MTRRMEVNAIPTPRPLEGLGLERNPNIQHVGETAAVDSPDLCAARQTKFYQSAAGGSCIRIRVWICKILQREPLHRRSVHSARQHLSM